MELICYLHPGWAPLIRPAPATRPWMDDTPESFAYRCLPLNIANAHGWEVLSPCGFEAVWNGGAGTDAVTITLDPGAPAERAPVSLFGQGVITFHIEAIFRTPPGWNLWVGGSPNRQKDAIQPLTGVVETDWSPFTFTMNWRFTRVGQPVRFEALEPICFLFPVQRAALEAFEPKFAPIEADPNTGERFAEWSRAREAFQEKMRRAPPKVAADKWQKHYYRGVDVRGEVLIDDHRSKLRLKAFDRSAAPHAPIAPADDPPARPASAPPRSADDADRTALRKREWLLETVERQRLLSPRAAAIERRAGISSDEFLERHYAANRPVILTGEMAGWPALGRWTPDYLARSLENADGAAEGETPPVLDADLGRLDKLLRPPAAGSGARLRIGPAGAFTGLRHELANSLIAQIRGRARLKILPASEAGRLYNHRHAFSEISDIEDPALDLKRYPRLDGARLYEVVLEPGEMIFMPVGWWRQVKALDFSVTATYTDFLWPNDAHLTYPGD